MHYNDFFACGLIKSTWATKEKGGGGFLAAFSEWVCFLLFICERYLSYS